MIIQPTPSLRIAGKDAHDRCEDGRKKITIREGFRHYVNGSVILCCPYEKWCMQATITKVRHARLKNVPLYEIQLDGFLTYEDALNGLRKYYPNLTYDSEVTVIHWEKG
jgi:hypothetical protein